MDNIVIILLILAIIGLAVNYIVKAKKSGARCIGCPHAKECGKNNDTQCSNK